MIYRGNDKIVNIYKGDKQIHKIYKNNSLVYSSSVDYTIVPYVISKGKSWADTGLFLDPTVHRVQGSFIVTDLSMVSASNIYLLEGARSGGRSVSLNLSLFKYSNSTYGIRRDWGTQSPPSVSIEIYEVGKEYLFDLTPEYTEINGVRQERTAISSGVCANSYYIGNANIPDISGYVPPGIHATSRTFSVWATGEVIAEIKPAQNNIDKSYQLVDIVSQKYLPNLGTEPFTKEGAHPLLALHSGGFLRLHNGAFLKLH